jgi:hypothetical protein
VLPLSEAALLAEARHRFGSRIFSVDAVGRLFDPDAARPRATLFQDWAADVLTATAADSNSDTHPRPDWRP